MQSFACDPLCKSDNYKTTTWDESKVTQETQSKEFAFYTERGNNRLARVMKPLR